MRASKLGRLLLAASPFAILHAPAFAGDTPLYEPVPAWVERTELPEGRARGGTSLVLFEIQERIEEGRLLSYQDTAIRIDNPQELTQVGTVTAQWMPDKGDLYIHGVTIVRDGEEIDALADGARFEVLRREQQLERRILDGSLTATLAVPGLRVGDILRVSYSTSLSDQALDKEVQTVASLPRRPEFKAGSARVVLSWPEDAGVNWMAGRGVEIDDPVLEDGNMKLRIDLPLDAAKDIPGDAPSRFWRPPLIQLSTFADWQELSSVMEPLFSPADTIADDSEIAREVELIEHQHADKLGRSVAALRLVQDRISYLLNGLDGGNYIPQSPAETWNLRYGDCKAKTLLLLAMLDRMGIESEAFLVASRGGDALPELLPMAANFDHVIVHARIDGVDYWLDGTANGANAQNIANVPAFHFGLPLRAEGAELYPVTPRLPAHPEAVFKVVLDQRAGPDLPTLYSGTWQLGGALGQTIGAMMDELGDEQKRQFAFGLTSSLIGANNPISVEMLPDSGEDVLLMKIEGIAPTSYRFDRGAPEQQLRLISQQIGFSPDRARRSWRDIPIVLPGPAWTQMELTVLLPETDEEFQLEGQTAVEADVAGITLKREVELDDKRLHVFEELTLPGGELPASEIAAVRQLAAPLNADAPKLVAPRNIQRSWRFAGGGDREELDAIEQAYSDLIATDIDNLGLVTTRANFRYQTHDYEGAMEDYSEVIEFEPGVGAYRNRAGLLNHLGRYEEALQDAEAAWELDPSAAQVMLVAYSQAHSGDIDGALDFLDEQGVENGFASDLTETTAEIEAMAGRVDQALALLDGELGQSPDDANLLNSKCWLMGSWSYQVEEALPVCTKAVELAVWSPPVLDSRAMAYFRLGEYDKALSDIESALSVAPQQVPSLLLRGLIRRESGDKGGEQDIADALARQPSLKNQFAMFGFSI